MSNGIMCPHCGLDVLKDKGLRSQCGNCKKSYGKDVLTWLTKEAVKNAGNKEVPNK